MAERLELSELERRRASRVPPSPPRRFAAANDNVPPVRHLVGKLLIAGASFAATFAFALWWLS